MSELFFPIFFCPFQAHPQIILSEPYIHPEQLVVLPFQKIHESFTSWTEFVLAHVWILKHCRIHDPFFFLLTSNLWTLGNDSIPCSCFPDLRELDVCQKITTPEDAGSCLQWGQCQSGTPSMLRRSMWRQDDVWENANSNAQHILGAHLSRLHVGTVRCSVMLGGGNGACSSCCCLLQVVRALPMFTFCFSGDVLSSWSARSTVPIFFLFFGCTRHRSSSRYRSRTMVVALFLGHRWRDHSRGNASGRFRFDLLFSFWVSQFLKQMRSSWVCWNNSIHFCKLVPWLRRQPLDLPTTCPKSVQGVRHGDTWAWYGLCDREHFIVLQPNAWRQKSW